MDEGGLLLLGEGDCVGLEESWMEGLCMLGELEEMGGDTLMEAAEVPPISARSLSVREGWRTVKETRDCVRYRVRSYGEGELLELRSLRSDRGYYYGRLGFESVFVWWGVTWLFRLVGVREHERGGYKQGEFQVSSCVDEGTESRWTKGVVESGVYLQIGRAFADVCVAYFNKYPVKSGAPSSKNLVKRRIGVWCGLWSKEVQEKMKDSNT